MHFGELSAPEQRVLGCLIEKRWTTPDGYPLSLNALRLACNQSTNRDPVTEYSENTVRDAAQRLCRYGLARLASGHNSRSTKYRHLADEALGLDRPELAVLAVVLLRGPQTPGEIKTRADRLAPMPSLADVERLIDALSARGYAQRMPRRPGHKEDRVEHLLGGANAPVSAPSVPVSAPSVPVSAPSVPASAPSVPASAPDTASDDAAEGAPGGERVEAGAGLAERVERLEEEVARLRAELRALWEQLG